MGYLEINKNLCNLCGKCVKDCPYSSLSKGEDSIIFTPEKCQMCGICLSSCQQKAISFTRTQAVQPTFNTQDYSGVWVFGETEDGKLHPVVFELLGKGQELAFKLKTDLELVVFADNFDIQQLSGHSIDNVIILQNKALKYFNAEIFSNTLAWLIGKRKPEVVLAGATAIGRSFLARVATLCRTGLTADCTNLDITGNNQLLQTRPAFGGNIMAEIICPDHRPQMATVRSRVFPRQQTVAGRNPPVEQLELPARFIHTGAIRLSYHAEEKTTSSLTDANIIISGGRGIGSKEGFETLERLATKIGAAVGASRSAVDMGWYPYSHQVGQTGKTVNPKIYIACGISGAVQHRIGISTSDKIIAINSDPQAPICQFADYVVIGDWKNILTNLEDILSKTTND